MSADSREAYAVFQREWEEWEQISHWTTKDDANDLYDRWRKKCPDGNYFILCRIESRMSA